MSVYVALLRGINTSGHRIIKMENLKAIFESMKFNNVQTYIQSGNVIFETPDEEVTFLTHSIENKLEEALGYKVPVMIRTMSELEEVIKQNPFVDNDLEVRMLYVTFLYTVPTSEAIDVVRSYQNSVDDFRIINREVYWLRRKGDVRSLFSNNFLENKLGVLATTRNWTTVNKIASMISRD